MRIRAFAALAWLQLATSLLLGSAVVWGYSNYQASLGLFLHSVAASVGAVSNVVGRTAETVDTRKELLDQTSQMLVVTRNLVNELRTAAENQTKLGPQYADGLHSASVVTGKLGNSIESLGDGLLRLSLPTGIQMVGMKPVIVMSQPMAKKGQELKDNAHEIKAISASLSGVSDAISRDAKNLSSAFIATADQALLVLTEVEKTLTRIKTQDLPKAIADLKSTSENLSRVSAQVDTVGNAGLILLIVGILLSVWCFLHSVGALMLARSGTFDSADSASNQADLQPQGSTK